ncbi:Phage head-tail joining protein [Pseudovibrio sp. W64]|uniref:phage head closure protein n=1 Tax=Pseudovibrio sp. W64 TaxID=1735583 RepID=UPI0007AEA52A|nr:phage head closure protein [Pseudovibrio sp. W64]KZK76486.1 Phage head-tail joining protein [Pseudovibrio sp. W64]
MRAGRLKDRVTFRRKASVSNGSGGLITSWNLLFKTVGELQMSKGKEVIAGGRIEASAMGVLSIRYTAVSADLSEADIAVIDGKTFNIRSIHDPERRKRRLELLLERGVAV